MSRCEAAAAWRRTGCARSARSRDPETVSARRGATARPLRIPWADARSRHRPTAGQGTYVAADDEHC
eukprot:3120715-Prymnesium_polylepis.1